MKYASGKNPNSRKRVGQLNRRHKACKTGCIGVSFTRVRVARAAGYITQRFYNAYYGRRNRVFCIDTLGNAAAFRRAVEWRARQELAAKGARA